MHRGDRRERRDDGIVFVAPPRPVRWGRARPRARLGELDFGIWFLFGTWDLGFGFCTGWKACATDHSIACLLSLRALLGPSRAGTARLQLRIDLRAVCSCRRGVSARVPHGLKACDYEGNRGLEGGRGCGLWHAFVHRGFLMQARRKRMLCHEDVKRSACGPSERGAGVGSQPGHSFPSRLATDCGAKSVPKPTRPGALPSKVSSQVSHCARWLDPGLARG